MAKKILILKVHEIRRNTLQKVMDEIKAALITGKNVILEIDIGETCPKCGGISIDGGDMWFKQYGRRYRTCIDCMYIWPEEMPT